MITLPSLKRQIRRNFFAFLVLYAVLGIVLVISVLSASRTSPKMIHVNYDSISAANRMKEAWDALAQPARYPQRTAAEWKKEFESALRFEEGNITEPGELEASRSLREAWTRASGRLPEGAADLSEAQKIEALLDRIVALNEKGMFGLAEENTNLAKRVLLFAVGYSLLTLILAVFLADGLAERLSRPLKRVAEVLQNRPPLDRPLRLPEPTNLELLILLQEVQHLWDRLSASAKINLEDLMVEKVKVDTILKSIEDALLVLDEDDVVVHCNETFLALLGLPSESVMNQSWQDLPTAGESYLKLRDLLHRNLQDGSVVDLVIGEGKELQKRNYAARWRNLRGIGGESSGSLYMLHDITEKRQKERFREEFIDLLSHELKTPLQSLGTASEILTEHKHELSRDLGLLVETIAEDVERIRGVASEFVQVTQSHAKVMKLKLQKTSLNQSLQEWLKPFRLVAKDRDVRLQLRHEGSGDIFANIDPVKFPWVVSNLVSNAIRYAPKGSLVDVLLTDRNGCIEINVQDEGAGVAWADQKKMFEPFYQGTGSGEVGRGLLGVGLTIAKEVVEAHDGRIEYYSRSPQGSTFRIVLPFPPYEYG